MLITRNKATNKLALNMKWMNISVGKARFEPEVSRTVVSKTIRAVEIIHVKKLIPYATL